MRTGLVKIPDPSARRFNSLFEMLMKILNPRRRDEQVSILCLRCTTNLEPDEILPEFKRSFNSLFEMRVKHAELLGKMLKEAFQFSV